MKHETNRRRARKIRNTLFFFVVLSIVGGTIWAVFFSPYFQLRDVFVSGTEALDAEIVRTAAKDWLSGTRFGVLPKSNALFYEPNELVEFLRGRFLRIVSLSVAADIRRHTVNIEVQERRPEGFWCSGADGECALFDIDGVLFEAISRPEGSGGLLMEDQSGNALAGQAPALGEQAVPPEWILFLKSFAEELAPEVWVRAYVIEPESFRAQYVRVRTGKGWEALINIEPGSERLSAEILKTLLKDEIGEKVSRLEYIDLRVPNRAYYKLR